MAEAHVATAFSLNITNRGVNVNVSFEGLKAILLSSAQSWRKTAVRIKNRVESGVYPAKPDGWLTMAFIVFLTSLCGFDISLGIILRIEHLCFLIFGIKTPENHTLASLWFSFLLWFIGVLIRRYTLKCLLSYMGWMRESRGKVSTKTKIWNVMLRIFSGPKPKLYSYQGSMPTLPVPKVDDTIKRYLKSVRPLMDDVQFNKMEELAKEYQTTIADRIQFFLVLKSWVATNYVSDWWEKFVYLSGRSPLMINSNFYGMDALFVQPTTIQAARAASMTHAMLRYMRHLNREELKPLVINGLVPLCSRQYERQFGTTRVPGVERDRLVQTKASQHVVVMHKGRFFKCFCNIDNRWLEPVELESIFQSILDDKSPPVGGEEHLAALTAGERIHWAKTRDSFFSSGINQTSLRSIESAAFVLALDDEDYDFDSEKPELLNRFGYAMLHGNCCDRWFDKSFTLVIGRNGRAGFNAEHSWADAPVMGQMWETCLLDDALGYDSLPETFPNNLLGVMRYKSDGHCRGESQMDFPGPIRLRWDLSKNCKEAIEQSLSVAQHLMKDIDLHIVVHQRFGKGFIKLCKVSPDAYIQLALQLAYFSENEKFCLTYEASMTRLFREGRTETVRSCSEASCRFVQLMKDTNATKMEKITALQDAASYHVDMYRDAMSGQGVDRHLFCMYVMSRYLGLQSDFLKEVLSDPWRLSTSQTPQGQTDRLDLKTHPNLICAGGGFGPVADDGYGVSYIIAGEDNIFFHVSCKNSCSATNSKRFGDRICHAMQEMRSLFV